jgi:succinate-semialdehyde dehydrogenase/glutarate-semialdehyde dehydrogenase
VLTNIKPGTPFSCEETFGPVVSVIEVKDGEEAVSIANATTYVLSATFLPVTLRKV